MNFEGINRLPNVGQGRRLAEMKQEDLDMMKALEEDLMDFHGRIEKSSTWWCPRMQDTTTTTSWPKTRERLRVGVGHDPSGGDAISDGQEAYQTDMQVQGQPGRLLLPHICGGQMEEDVAALGKGVRGDVRLPD